MLSKYAVYSVEWCDGQSSTWAALDPIIAIKRAIKERNVTENRAPGAKLQARHIVRVSQICTLDTSSPRPSAAADVREEVNNDA